MKDKIAIFDFDGTLSDTKNIAVEIYNTMAVKHGYHNITSENLPSLSGMSVAQIAKFLDVPMYKLPFLLKEGRDLFKAKRTSAKWFDGIPEVLQKLKGLGYRLYIISSNSKENVEEFLGDKKFLFQAIESSSILGKHVPINRIVKNSGEPKENVWYIGDEIRDTESGKKAGVKTLAVAWGYNTKEGLKSANPDQIATTPEELFDILANA